MNGISDKNWFVFLLPGFISLFVAGFVSDFPFVRDVLIPFVYVALTAFSVALPLFIIHIYARIFSVQIYFSSLIQSASFLFAVFVASIVLGFIFGVAHSSDSVSRFLREVFGKNLIIVSSHTEPIKLLFREAYQPSFVDEFDGIPLDYIQKKEKNVYVRIRTQRNGVELIVHGVVHSYHSHTERPQAYLSPACKEVDRVIKPVKGPGAWVNLEDVQSVEFLYQACSPCAAAVKSDTGHGAIVRSCPFN